MPPAAAKRAEKLKEASRGEPELWYVGVRGEDRCKVYTLYRGGSYSLPPRTDVRNHSPTGFEWGYEGSGPAQLSLALLLDAVPTSRADLAAEHYQGFKRAVVGRLPRERWALRRSEVLRWTVDGALPDVLTVEQAEEEYRAATAGKVLVDGEEE